MPPARASRPPQAQAQEQAQGQAQAQAASPPATAGPRLLSPLDELLARARSSLRAGEPRAAWQTLRERVDLYAGIAVYDHLQGVAALDAGLPGEAVLALERVLIVEPDNLPARAEIARA